MVQNKRCDTQPCCKEGKNHGHNKQNKRDVNDRFWSFNDNAREML